MGISPPKQLNLTKRSKVLGMPVGPKQVDWKKAAIMGFGVASSVAPIVKAKRAGQNASGKVSEAVAKGKDAVAQGKDAVESVSSIGKQAGSVGKAMSGASTPFGKVAAAFKPLGGGGNGNGNGGGGEGRNVKKLRMIIKKSIDVAVPRKVAYNQWTQFTELPSIIKGVESVDQQEDDVTRWTAKIGPSRRSWTAEILEQTPDEKIVWRSKDGPDNRGVVTFHSLDGSLTRVQVEMEYFPSGIVEKVGNIWLSARRRVGKDLRLFKHYMELAGKETGAWRGEISKDEEDEQSEENQEQGQSEQDQEQGQSEQDQEQGQSAQDQEQGQSEESSEEAAQSNGQPAASDEENSQDGSSPRDESGNGQADDDSTERDEQRRSSST